MSDCNVCKSSGILVFSCSGGSNVGQITNQAALELTNEGKGKMYCLSGLGGHIPGIIETAKKAEKIVVIDGCPVSCAKKMVEHVNLPLDHYVVVTEEGIEKTPGRLEMTEAHIGVIKNRIVEMIG